MKKAEFKGEIERLLYIYNKLSEQSAQNAEKEDSQHNYSSASFECGSLSICNLVKKDLQQLLDRL